MLNAAEGINAELNWSVETGIQNFVLNINNIEESTVLVLANAASAIGDRATFLNNGAVLRPHRIGAYTEMSCTAIPGSAGVLPYQNGDRFYHMEPAPGNYIGVVRTAGVWHDFGAVV